MSRDLRATDLPLRGFRSFTGGMVMLALLVFVLTTVFVAWPRATSLVLDSELRASVATSSAAIRDLQGSADALDGFVPASKSHYAPWLAMPSALARARAQMPASVRAITAPGRYVARFGGKGGRGIAASGTADAPPNSNYLLTLEADPLLRSDAVLNQGHWPAKVAGLSTDQPIEVVMTTASARFLHWSIGQTQTIASDFDEAGQPVILVGTVRPANPSADFWQLDRTRAQAGAVVSVDGEHTTYNGVMWTNSQSWENIDGGFEGETILAWNAVRAGSLTAATLPKTEADLQRYLAVPRRVGGADSQTMLRFTTRFDDIADAFAARAVPASALLVVVGAGPLGIGLAVLLLTILLAADRRAPTARLMRSRGAAPRRLALLAGIETAIPTIPAALLGGAVAVAITPTSFEWTLVWTVAACCIVPASLAAIACLLSLRRTVPSRTRTSRWIAELLTLLLAALAVSLTIEHGTQLSSEALAEPADPLLVLTPLLVSAAVCVLALRVLPALLLRLGALLRGGTGVVGYLGWATSARSAIRFLPVFAVVTGVSVTLFSAALLTTEQTGIRDATLTRVGADISVTGTPLDASTIRQLQALPGVEHTATIDSAGGISLDGVSTAVALYSVDARALALVQSNLSSADRQFARVGTTNADRDVAIGGGFQQHPPSRSAIQGTPPIAIQLEQLVGVAPTYLTNPPWVLIDRSALPAGGHFLAQPLTILIKAKGEANGPQLLSQVEKVAGPNDTVVDADELIASAQKAPMVVGFAQLTLAAIALSALLCLAALVLSLVIGTAARVRLFGRLRALGFSARQTAGVAYWEIGPTVVPGIVVGLVVAGGLVALMFQSIDLAGFTGGGSHPAPVLSPLVVSAAVLALLVAGVIAVLVAVAVTRRATASRSSATEGED